jgi:exodeoxyribonuclease VII large subunit
VLADAPRLRLRFREMTGTIELDPDGKNLQIRFPYRPDLVEDVKSIPGRRWDKAGKMWRVPTGQVDNVVAILMRHGFTMSADVSSLFAGTAGSAPSTTEEANEAPAKNEAPEALSISGLNESVKKAIQGAFPEPVWVVGELADYDKNKDRQHLFFNLLEKRGEKIVAQVDVAMFERTAKMVRARLDNLPEPMTLADGIEIRVRVRVDLYPRNGRFQLIIEDIDPSFTLGKLALDREEILRELREKGLDHKNRDLPVPVPALRVGVLTSLDSDGWNDFYEEVKTSGIGFHVTSYNVRVQGDRLKPSMLQGLKYFKKRAKDFDVLCIIRGGGSRTDLAWFDDRDVAIAVANHPLKIVCGIGHQRDQSVLDVITYSENTPTAVADFLIDQYHHAREVLADLSRCFVDLVRRVLRVEERRLTELGHKLRHRVQGAMIFERERLKNAAGQLGRATTRRVRGEQDNLVRRGERVRSASAHRVERARAVLETQSARLRLLDPQKVLERGYTITRDAKGTILTDVTGLTAGAVIEVQFRNGRARTTIESATKNKKKPGN